MVVSTILAVVHGGVPTDCFDMNSAVVVPQGAWGYHHHHHHYHHHHHSAGEQVTTNFLQEQRSEASKAIASGCR